MCDTHDGRAVCWRCSDAVAWWAEARGGPITCNCQYRIPEGEMRRIELGKRIEVLRRQLERV